MDQEISVHTADGRRVVLGTVAAVGHSFQLITRLTGGSSGQGRWSWLWGFLFQPSDPVSPEEAVLLAGEAADLRRTFSEQLSPEAAHLLDRIAGFVDARTRMLHQWDRTIKDWLHGEDDLPPGLAEWRDSYGGRGVDTDAMPEPFIGDWLAPKFVVLGLNPGIADLTFQGRCGHFAKQVEELGYAEWAKADPYAGDLWELENTVNKKNRFGRAVNRYRHARLEFARRFVEDIQPHELLIVELYPWHSKSWDTSRFGPGACREALEEFIWEPLGKLRLDHHIFAFGKSWLGVAKQLGLKRVTEFGQGEFCARSRAAAVFELPSSQQQLVVLWQSGYAGPPSERDTARLRDLLRSQPVHPPANGARRR